MDKDVLRQMLDDVQHGRVSVEAALTRLAGLPFEDLGFAKIDHHRALRAGGPEAVFCPGKTPEQVVAIVGATDRAPRQRAGHALRGFGRRRRRGRRPALPLSRRRLVCS